MSHLYLRWVFQSADKPAANNSTEYSADKNPDAVGLHNNIALLFSQRKKIPEADKIASRFQYAVQQ